jgi:hypothetical protein
MLFEMDAADRWIPTYEELEGGLRRLTETGWITELTPRTYARRSRPSAAPHHHTPLTLDEYESALAAYHDAFDDAIIVAPRSILIRAMYVVVNASFRLSRGRVGAPVDATDDVASARRAVVRKVARHHGGSLGPLTSPSDVELIRGIGAASRPEFRAAVARELRRHGLAEEPFVLMFDDGARVTLSASEKV